MVKPTCSLHPWFVLCFCWTVLVWMVGCYGEAEPCFQSCCGKHCYASPANICVAFSIVTKSWLCLEWPCVNTVFLTFPRNPFLAQKVQMEIYRTGHLRKLWLTWEKRELGWHVPFAHCSSHFSLPAIQTQCLELEQPPWNHEVGSHALRTVEGERRLVPWTASAQHCPPMDCSWCEQNKHLLWLGLCSWFSVTWAEHEPNWSSSLHFRINTLGSYCIFCLSQMFEHPCYVWRHSDMERWASP